MKSDAKVMSVKKGSVTVKIYTREKEGRSYYQVSDYSSGRRKFKNFADLTTAKSEATNIAEKMNRGQAAALKLSTEDRSLYLRSLEYLKETKVPLDIAARNYSEACKLLGEDSVLEAVKFYIQKTRSQLSTKSVQQVYEEFLQSKISREKQSDDAPGLSHGYIKDIRYRCGRFAEAFQCQIHEITAPQIEDFLHGLKLSPRSYINFRRVLRTMFDYARRRGYTPKDEDPFEQVERIKDYGSEIAVYSLTEMKRLMFAADTDYLPCLAFGGFAGLRSSEIERLCWEDVHLDEKFIEIRKGKTKTRTRRIVPISDNLSQWLSKYSGLCGKVWPFSHEGFYDAQQDTAARTANHEKNLDAISWKQNALRHSFISYRLALIQNANQVALESGNSVSIIFAHYRELVRPKEAEQWFSITPQKEHTGKVKSDKALMDFRNIPRAP
jgi:integrase